MDYQTDRRLLMEYEPGLIFRTSEMIAWLHVKTGIDPDMGDAVLGSWVSVLHAEVLRRALLDRTTLQRLEVGREVLVLSHDLAPRRRCLGPGNWTNDQLWTRISERTGLLHRDVSFLLSVIAEKLRELDSQRAFQPVGWVVVSSESEFEAHLWKDFLQPISDRKVEVYKDIVFAPRTKDDPSDDPKYGWDSIPDEFK